MHRDHEHFITSVHSKNKVLLTFYSKEDGRQLQRTCAPMDFGPSSRAKDKSDRYHFWDYDSDKTVHTLSLVTDQVMKIEPLSDQFEPAEFVVWTPNWSVPRDWGRFS